MRITNNNVINSNERIIQKTTENSSNENTGRIFEQHNGKTDNLTISIKGTNAELYRVQNSISRNQMAFESLNSLAESLLKIKGNGYNESNTLINEAIETTKFNGEPILEPYRLNARQINTEEDLRNVLNTINENKVKVNSAIDEEKKNYVRLSLKQQNQASVLSFNNPEAVNGQIANLLKNISKIKEMQFSFKNNSVHDLIG